MNGKIPISRGLAENLGYVFRNNSPSTSKIVSYRQALFRAKRLKAGRSPVPRNTSPSSARSRRERRRPSSNSPYNFR